MSRILEEFPRYLEEWCKKNHKPVPPVGTINKFWQLAWQDYMKEKLVPQWEDIKEEYLNMDLLNKNSERKIQKEIRKQEFLNSLPDEEPEKELSMWERIKQKRKN